MVGVAVSPAQQRQALWLSTFAFTVCFAVWTIFAIIGIQIKKDLGLSETQFGLLVGTPILTGSLIRLLLGIWADQYGGRVVYTLTMLSAAVMTGLLTFAYDYTTFLLAALGVGIAGGSFSVGVAYVAQMVSEGEAGHRAWHLRCRQCRRGGHQVHRALHHGRDGLEERRADLGGHARHHRDHLLPVHQGRSGFGARGAPRARSRSRFRRCWSR